MIVVKKNNFLTYRKKNYRCSLGINGLSKKKVEGDQCTPVGIFTLGNLYVRTDKIKNLKTNFDYSSITKTMAWSDEPNSKNYNKLIDINHPHTEKMYRNDNIYDLILVINYNLNPTIPYKGSAIFIHVTTENYIPTAGCIALKIDDFKEILTTLNPSEKVKIIDN